MTADAHSRKGEPAVARRAAAPGIDLPPEEADLDGHIREVRPKQVEYRPIDIPNEKQDYPVRSRAAGTTRLWDR